MNKQREVEPKGAPRSGNPWRATAIPDYESLDTLEHKHAVRSEQCEQRELRREAFNHMQDILVTSAQKRLFYSIGTWGSSLLFLWLMGAMVFYFAEQGHQERPWSYFQSIYFAYIALTGIGYGDFALKSSAGRAFFFLWSMVVVPTITMLIKTVVDAVGSTYVLGKIFSMSSLKHIFLRRGTKVAERDLEAGRSFLHARIIQ